VKVKAEQKPSEDETMRVRPSGDLDDVRQSFSRQI